MSYAVKKKTKKIDKTYIKGDGLNEKVNPCLTKLELIAAMAMQGLLSNNVPYKKTAIPEMAVDNAKALLKELEGSEGE